MTQLIILTVMTWILFRLFLPLRPWLKRKWKRMSVRRTASIFEKNHLESNSFYLYRFRRVPCDTYVYDIDVTKAFAYIQDSYRHQVVDIYQSCFFNRQSGKQEFTKTLFVLNNKVIVELNGQYAKILYPNNRYGFANSLVLVLSEYKLPERQEVFEINIITSSGNGLDLKPLEIKPVTLDLGLYYNDDFMEVDQKIRNRLSEPNDKGIVLLHGLPGTGKTTYLRHLIGELKKKVLFVSPSVAGNLMNPEFIDLLIDNPNSILVIEDAENIMMDRKYNSGSSVSNLLNLSDGLLSDCLSVQIVCTFNSSLSMIDSALMRKGRLIATYEFGKLGVEKSRVLSKYLGFDRVVTGPMTIAEIANPDDRSPEVRSKAQVGFRRMELMAD